MGGKQKRAAKLKRWLQSQNPHNGTGEEGTGSTKFKVALDGSGDHLQNLQPVPINRKEVVKRRLKSIRQDRRQASSWIGRRVARFFKGIEHLPSWPFSVCFAGVIYVLVFLAIRFVVQLVTAEATSADRSFLYSSLKSVVPTPVYKLVLVLDYLFCSKQLSLKGIQSIIYPPDEYYKRPSYNEYSEEEDIVRSA